uniref:Cystathionine gamma-synthase n=1 Tax=Erythrolobus australicus TaxID=1077150 RepID=A0A7S1XHW8_9RHOD
MAAFVAGAGIGRCRVGGGSVGWSMKSWTRGMPPPRAGGARARRVVLAMMAPDAAKTVEIMAAAEMAEREGEQLGPDATVRAYVRAPDEKMASMNDESAEMAYNVLRVDPGGVSEERRALLRDAASSTRAVHGGERPKGGKKARAVLDAITTPVVQSATFTFRNSRECIEYNEGNYASFEYGRYGNPTTRAAEEKLMLLEGADDALLSSSGMNAVTTMLLALLPAGGHIVVTTDCYRRTRQFVQTLLPKMGITCTVLDPADVNALEKVLAERGADLYFSESPTNPMVRVVDVPAVAALCAKYNTICCIDTTFATAYNYRPIEHGAHLVLHSGTKYLAGHNDVICGALAGDAHLIAQVRALHGVLGGVLDPHSAYLLLRGMKTLSLRLAAQNRNAEALARFLEAHPKVSRVHYPTIAGHPDYKIAQQQLADGARGFGGVLSFELAGDGNPWSTATFEAANRFVDALRIPYIGPSLGGVESLVEQVCIMGYYDQPLETRQRLGISNGFIRFACGIEDSDDVIADVANALDAA